MKNKKVIALSIACLSACSIYAQTEAELDVYRKNFDNIIYFTPVESQRIEKIKAEIPAAFFAKKGFYALTKSWSLKVFPL